MLFENELFMLLIEIGRSLGQRVSQRGLEHHRAGRAAKAEIRHADDDIHRHVVEILGLVDQLGLQRHGRRLLLLLFVQRHAIGRNPAECQGGNT